MKSASRILTVWALLALCAAPARAQVSLDGKVEYGQSVTQFAKSGGTAASVSVQAGAYVEAGDVLATLSVTPVFAPCDGTVEILFAGEGESADTTTQKYGGVLSIIPENRYVVYPTAEYAYQSVRATHIVVGQVVYMKCTVDGSHRGTGIITDIDGEIFTVEATGGSFYNGETVYVYMEADYGAADRLGKGTVVATAAQTVAAEGDVSKLYVREGDFVEKGQRLFETLAALPDGDGGGDALALTAEVAGYVTTVYAAAGDGIQRDAPLAEICPADGLVASARVSEPDVASVRGGDGAAVTIELAEETLRLRGTVLDVSYRPRPTKTAPSAIPCASACRLIHACCPG